MTCSHGGGVQWNTELCGVCVFKHARVCTMPVSQGPNKAYHERSLVRPGSLASVSLHPPSGLISVQLIDINVKTREPSKEYPLGTLQTVHIQANTTCF